MKTAIKLILIYIGMQILGVFIAMIFSFAYLLATGGSLEDAKTLALVPGMLLSMVLMGVYMWKAGYISKEKVTWSDVSFGYMLLTGVITIPAIWVIDALVTPLHLPDLIESSMETLLSSWAGILCITLVGPVLEELIFRGAITKSLLANYKPSTAIIVSGLIFGVFHLNPAQILPAALIGILLAWMYYKTASLIPCIVVHIINNSLSVFLGLRYPEVETINELVGGDRNYWILTGVAVVIAVASLYLMKRTHVKYPWKGEEVTEVITTNE